MRLKFPRAARVGVLLAGLVALVGPMAASGAGAARNPLGADGSLPSGTAIVNESPVAWLVELKSSTAQFHADAKATGLRYTERFAYTRLFKGVSVSVGSADLGKLRGLSSVARLYPVNTYTLGPVSTIEPELATSIGMIGADVAQSEMGLTGHGVKVAVMDTGIDVDHPDLGGDGSAAAPQSFPNSRIVAGWDFVGDSYNADPTSPSYQPIPSPDSVPDDCNGHGTHVSGIVGANGSVKGVAPEVSLGAYRVFGCEGSTTDDVMIAAMERILADGMQVLNMSIGDAFNTWPGSPTAAASDALVDAGMVVVASIGNSGASGLYSAGAPGVGNRVIGVASYDNSAISALTFNVPGRTGVPYLPIANVPDPPTSGTVPNEIVVVGRGCNVDTYPVSPSGKIALVTRGTCTFDEKYQKAAAAGAVGVIIRNNVTGLFAGGGVTPVAGKFLVAVSKADGDAIAALDAAGRASLTWTNIRVNSPNPTGGLISSFSSYGLAADLNLKPDIGAPGGLIRSTYPLENGGYAIISGTSMASPHVAGSAALLKEARPSLAAGAFRGILMNSADPKPWSGAPSLPVFDYVFRQGAGMLDIDDAARSATTITPAKVALGEGAGHSATFTLQNSGTSSVTYKLGYIESLAAGPPGALPFTWSIYAGVPLDVPISTATFSSPMVTVPAGGSATVGATVALDPFFATLGRTLYGGWITFTPEGIPAAPYDQVYRVPVAGFGGDYQEIVAMPTVPLGGGFQFPSIGREVEPFTFDLLPADQGGTWGLTGADDIPNVLLHFDHQVQRLTMQVVKAGNGNPVHPVFSRFLDQRMLSRNAGPTGFFAFPWDGTRMQDNGKGTADHRKSVPDGQYKIVVKALKALGDAGNPAHVETWTSPTITIDRP